MKKLLVFLSFVSVLAAKDVIIAENLTLFVKEGKIKHLSNGCVYVDRKYIISLKGSFYRVRKTKSHAHIKVCGTYLLFEEETK